LDKKWVNGTVLHYYFFPGSTETQKTNVRNAFKEWKAVGIGLNFVEVQDRNQSEIRIGWDKGSSWSYLGTDCLARPMAEQTMNFGWDLNRQPGTSLHEIGHALGFPHEHQNPYAGIVWDEEKVYASLAAPPNEWSRQTTFNNILAKLDTNKVQGSVWDRDSIMHYPFEAGLILKPELYQTKPLIPAGGLSALDKSVALQFYPPLPDAPPLRLNPFESVQLNLKPGEQVDYLIEPVITGDHIIQTLGSADTLLTLFEDKGNGNTVFMKADDDAGTDRNALIRIRLYQGSRYIVRARLYSTFKSGVFGLVYSFQ